MNPLLYALIGLIAGAGITAVIFALLPREENATAAKRRGELTGIARKRARNYRGSLETPLP